MRTRTLMVVVVAAAVLIAATLSMRGDGHRRLAKMLPAIHGNR
ncbi:MAG: hypothetical protein ABIQ52_09765 [Vicinamibacterales bacterium]